MDSLFNDWKNRYDATINHSKKSSQDNQINDINKNDNNTLRTIILYNHKHQKRQINEEFMMKQKEAKGTELLDTIAPLTTDKASLIVNLEEDRQEYMKQKRFKNGVLEKCKESKIC